MPLTEEQLNDQYPIEYMLLKLCVFGEEKKSKAPGLVKFFDGHTLGRLVRPKSFSITVRGVEPSSTACLIPIHPAMSSNKRGVTYIQPSKPWGGGSPVSGLLS